MHPDYLLEALTAEQFAEWSEFYALEPWGFGVDEARFGMLGSVIAATAGGKIDPKKFTVLPEQEPEQDLGARLLAHFKAHDKAVAEREAAAAAEASTAEGKLAP